MIMNGDQDTIQIDLKYLDPTADSFHDTLRHIDSKYFLYNKRKLNEKVLILDLSSHELTQKALDQVLAFL